MFSSLFGKGKVQALNLKNNEAVHDLILKRVAKIPHPLCNVEQKIIFASHYIVDALIKPRSEMTEMISKDFGTINSDQFTRLYHAVSWALVALISNQNSEVWETLPSANSLIIGPPDQFGPPEFYEALNRVSRCGGHDFMGVKLFAQIIDILKIPDESRAGGLMMIVVLRSATDAIENN